jgi:hypothetical protein
MTHGLSPKAVLAFLFPAIATVAGVLIASIATGALDAGELRMALAGLASSALAALGAWIGQPGNVTQRIGPASDDLLAALAPDELLAAPGALPLHVQDLAELGALRPPPAARQARRSVRRKQ